MGEDSMPLVATPIEMSQEVALMRAPERVLQDASRAAKLLMEVVNKKPDPVIFNGKRYLDVNDWQTLGRMYGLTATVVSTESIDHNGANGFLARAELMRSDGVVVSAAEAMCLNDEDNWSTRPKYEWMSDADVPEGAKVTYRDKKKKRSKVYVGEVPVPAFQLRSMAQTRAIGKAHRHALGYVAVLAGYSATPAEEMTGDEPEAQGDDRAPVQTPQAKKPAKQKPAAKPAEAAPAAAPADGNVTEGMVTQVTQNTGKSERGPWVNFRVQVDGSTWYGTFDAELGMAADEARTGGYPVKITWEQDGNFRNLLALEPVVDEQGVPH